MAFKSIMITEVKAHYTAEHIAFILLTKEICRVSSITLIPQIYNEEIYNIAYIDIYSYCDTEAAYEFIHHIKYGVFILHHDNDPDNVWTLQNNTHNSGGLKVGTYTTKFYYDKNDNFVTPQYPTFQDFKIEYALNNCQNVTLRQHQHSYKQLQENINEIFMWRNEIVRSVSDLSV